MVTITSECMVNNGQLLMGLIRTLFLIIIVNAVFEIFVDPVSI